MPDLPQPKDGAPDSTPSATPITTSSDPKSKRPTKKRALSPTSQQSAHISALFSKPHDFRVPTAPEPKKLPPPPDIVANVQGSSAGAGSGEFHVYKATRRREYERLRLIEEEKQKEEADEEFRRKKEEQMKIDEAKRNKNRARREKERLRKEKGKGKDAASVSKPEPKTDLEQPKVGRDGKGNCESDSAITLLSAKEKVTDETDHPARPDTKSTLQHDATLEPVEEEAVVIIEEDL